MISVPSILDRSASRFILLGISACLIAPVSLFVHDFMLEWLDVPYPRIVGVPVWAASLALLAKLVAVVVVCRISEPRLQRVSALIGAGAIGLLMLMLHETGRVIVIEHSIYGSWAAALLNAAPAAVALFLEVSIVAYASFRGVRRPFMLALTGAMALIGVALVSPTLVAYFGMVRDADFKNVVELYSDPYPPFLNVIIYTAFIEPTVAAFALAVLCWPGLRGGNAQRVAIFTLLLLFVRGRVGLELVSSFWVQGPIVTAFLATGQFFLETMVLGLLAGASWTLFRPRPTPIARVARS